MSVETLSAIAGVILSLLLSYIPRLSAWYGAKDNDVKRLIMLGLLALVAAASFGLACGGLAGDFGLAVTCDKAGAIALVRAFGVAAIANQVTYQLTPKSKSRAAGK